MRGFPVDPPPFERADLVVLFLTMSVRSSIVPHEARSMENEEYFDEL